MIKKFLMLGCLILGLGVLYWFGFCQSKTNTESKIIVQYASWGSESEINILKPILNDFEKENPNIKIDFMHIPQNYFQKLHLLFASNTAPDVVFINNQYLPIYANANVLEDLTEKSNIFDLRNFYEKSLQTMTWNGKIYAVPRDISNLVIYYNKDIFDKNNMKYPHNNWTMDDFLLTAKKLTKRPDVYGISFEEEPLFYLPYLMSFGVDYIPDFKDKTTQKGLKFYADLRKKYYVAPKRQNSASATMAQMFLQGRLGMHLSGRWLVPKYRQEAKFDWDVVSFPSGGAGSVIPMDSSGWAVAKSSKHKNEAYKLIQYLSSKESVEKITRSGLIVPARIDVANSEVFLDSQKPKSSYVFLDTIENSVPTPVTVNYREILDNLKKQSEYLFN